LRPFFSLLALYRFNGVEQKDSLGVLDLVSFVTKLVSVINALERAAKAAGTGSAGCGFLFGALKADVPRSANVSFADRKTDCNQSGFGLNDLHSITLIMTTVLYPHSAKH
jgi:hypothetical protein